MLCAGGGGRAGDVEQDNGMTGCIVRVTKTPSGERRRARPRASCMWTAFLRMSMPRRAARSASSHRRDTDMEGEGLMCGSLMPTIFGSRDAAQNW